MRTRTIDFHVHPFMNKWARLPDVLIAMKNRGVDVIGAEALNASIYPFLKESTKQFFPNAIIGKRGIEYPSMGIILNAGEYNTRENFHVLTVGYSLPSVEPPFLEIRKMIDTNLEEGALVILDHPFVDNGRTRTAGHITDAQASSLEKICEEYSGQIAIEWNAYCRPDMRKWAANFARLMGRRVRYYDVNSKALHLARITRNPVISDTDLHARRIGHLDFIGSSYISVVLPDDISHPDEIFNAIKYQIFSGDGYYSTGGGYASRGHLLEAFCIPAIFPLLFPNFRAKIL